MNNPTARLTYREWCRLRDLFESSHEFDLANAEDQALFRKLDWHCGDTYMVSEVHVGDGEGAGVPPSVGTRSAATEEQPPISTHPDMDPDAYIATLDNGREWPQAENT